jgi:hypothetical protein
LNAKIIAPDQRGNYVVLEDDAESRLAGNERARRMPPLLDQRRQKQEGKTGNQLKEYK